MKGIILLISTLLIILMTQIIDIKGESPDNDKKYIIVLHGGTGSTRTDIPDSLKEVYLNSLTEALNIGKKILEEGGTALDAVENTIIYLENNSYFNAGKGAVFTSAGIHELDASIMDGKDLSSGAVTGVKHIKNPVSLARLVMEKSPHVLFHGEGAEEFGRKVNVEFVDNDYFHTPEQLTRWKRKNAASIKGTVGCVALDLQGNLAAATSTGGISDKMPGRVGDSPLINAGTYANNNTCAVSCSGTGELFIKNTVAYNISALMEYGNFSLNEAVKLMIHERLPKGSGGLIAIDKNGNYTAEFNTDTMFRGIADSDNKFEVKIWR
jgi:L-asparaginase / beta-aspartyl-peptidase